MTNEEKKPEMTVVPGHVGYSPDYKADAINHISRSTPSRESKRQRRIPPESDPASPTPTPSGRIPVLVEVTIKMVVDVPSEWINDIDESKSIKPHLEGLVPVERIAEADIAYQVESYLNNSSHCANNELRRLAGRLEKRGAGCACNHIESKFVRVATEADQETYHYEEKTQ